jgi:hypothetical protein
VCSPSSGGGRPEIDLGLARKFWDFEIEAAEFERAQFAGLASLG